MTLPQKLPLPLMQTQWAAKLNPVLANPLNGVNILTNVPLIHGVNVINHLLGRLQQGWFLTDLQAAIVIYRSAPFNATTLTLTASSPTTVNIGVF